MNEPITRYGLQWKAGTSALSIEFSMIRSGGYKTNPDGKQCGEGLLFHFLAARKLIWPERVEHRWTRLMYEEIIKNVITVLMGAASTGKTATAAEWVLIDYWVHPMNTLVLVTTTNVEKLESNIFGEIKSLWSKGKRRFPWLAGNIVDHKHAIFTDDIETELTRDQRRGIKGKACYEGTQWVGDSVFVGIKQERVTFVGDELQYMAGTFIRSWNPLFANPSLKVIGSGNPNHNPDDPLGISAEPKDGWQSINEPEVTTCWDTKYMNGRCVNLVGTDSPNFEVQEDQPEPYKFLIGRRFVRRVIHDSGLNSPEYYRLVKGVMNFSLAHTRVITRQLCRQHKAHDKAEWSGGKRTKIYAIDPAYGGGDRCVIGWVEFGDDLNGKPVIRIASYRSLAINLRLSTSPEDQIANAVHDEMTKNDIPYKNGFYGAFGKGTIGFAFARKFGADSPVPIEEGGRPSQRPVRKDLFIMDENRRELRLKRCDEHYDRKITELWFSVRYTVEAEQLRELSEEMMAEGCSREYHTAAGDKIAVETKEDMKERLARSPDLFDWLCWEKGTRVLTPCGEVPIEKLRAGDSVVTPFGVTKIAIVHESFTDDLATVRFSNGRSLTGKRGHKVFTFDRGWVRMDTLTVANECESSDNLPVWHILNSCFTTAGNTGFKQLVGTIRTATKMHRRDFYTGACGSIIMALFRMAWTFITRTTTGRTPESTISNWLQSDPTRDTTCSSGCQTQPHGRTGFATRLWRWLRPRSGTAPQREENGTVKTPSTHGRAGLREKQNVLFAGEHLKNSLPKQDQATFAPKSVQIGTAGISTGRLGLAWSAIRILWRSNILRQKLVPVSARLFSPPRPEKVYNLTLLKDNVYYANGVLVENCFAVDGARQRGFVIANLGPEEAGDDPTGRWLSEKVDGHLKLVRSKRLVLST